MSDFDRLKQAAYEANMELPRRGLELYTFGNVSACDRDRGVFAIKPSGIPYEQLTPADMVVCDLHGRRVDGTLNPSSDTRTHAVLYRHFRGIGGVAHTHSTYATAWAQAAKPVPILGTTHSDHLAVDIPCTASLSDDAITRGEYEEETGNEIVRTFASFSADKVEMVLVANHGPFSWGKNAAKAVYNSVILEELARMALLTLQANPDTPPLKKALIDKHYYRKHGDAAYYGNTTTRDTD